MKFSFPSIILMLAAVVTSSSTRSTRIRTSGFGRQLVPAGPFVNQDYQKWLTTSYWRVDEHHVTLTGYRAAANDRAVHLLQLRTHLAGRYSESPLCLLQEYRHAAPGPPPPSSGRPFQCRISAHPSSRIPH